MRRGDGDHVPARLSGWSGANARLGNGAENFLEEFGDARGGIFADARLFVGDDDEQTIEGFGGDVLIDVEIISAQEDRGERRFGDQVFVSGGDAGFFGGIANDGEKFLGKLIGGGAAEIFGGGGFGWGEQEIARVGDGHLRERVGEDAGGDRDGLLGGVIHGGDKLIDQRTMSNGAEHFVDAGDLGWEFDFDEGVGEVAVGAAQRGDSAGETGRDGFFDAG